MAKTMFIGDVHGLWNDYMALLDSTDIENTVQVGDFGWGYPHVTTKSAERLNNRMSQGNHKYIRGNHDNPDACKKHEFCIEDPTYDPDTGVFYMGGAHSIDWRERIPGVDWWMDEELSIPEMNAAIDLYEKTKPRVVVTHDGPEYPVRAMFSWCRSEYSSRTRDALQAMFEIHQPQLWIFGHWHKHVTYSDSGTTFICLPELGTVVVDL